MKAKLIKTGNEYLLKDLKGEVLAITSGLKEGRMLSLKNCQAIERGYDLDELAKEKYPYEKTEMFSCFELDCKQEGFIEGAKTILEIRSDKKFSSRNMLKAFITGVFTDETSDYDFEFTELMQDLQQTEWDVEICCYVEENNGWIDADTFNSLMLIGTGEPKLDADGCLILKRI